MGDPPGKEKAPPIVAEVLREEYEASQLWLKRIKDIESRKRDGAKGITSSYDALKFRAEAEYIRQELIRKIAKRLGITV